MLPLKTVAKELGPLAAATSSAVRTCCISLQCQPALSAFLSSCCEKAKGAFHQQCIRTHLLPMQRELLQMMLVKSVSLDCCQVVAAGNWWVFFLPHVVKERTGLESG